MCHLKSARCPGRRWAGTCATIAILGGERKKDPGHRSTGVRKVVMLERETVRNPNQSFFGFGMTLVGTGGAGGASSVGLGGAGGADMTGAAPVVLGACEAA